MNDTDLPIEKMSLSELIDALHSLRDEKRSIAARDKILTAQSEEIELIIVDKFKSDNCTSFKTQKAGATLSTQEQPIISNIDEFEQFIKATGALYLLQRRISSKACLELHEMGETPPGISIMVKEKIALRSV